MSESIEAFEIRVDDPVLEDLHRRLAQTRFPDQIADTGWEYGIPVDYLRQLVEFWRDSYDWRSEEARLNGFEHFRTDIDGQRIHFIHARSAHPDARPLLLTHGWPGSFVEFLDVIPRLTNPESYGGQASDAFHVIVPSLPGYGFSEPPRSPGWDVPRIARAFIALMDRLDYPDYVAQGGDWGAQVTTWIASLDPEHCAAIHLNMASGVPPQNREPLTEEEQADLAAMKEFANEESGYANEQGTKPQTLGVALNDSPAGLLAWIVEKFRTWSDCDGQPGELLHPPATHHQRHGVLGHPDQCVLGPTVLGTQAQFGRSAALRPRAHRRGALSQGGTALAPLMGRAPVQRRALGRDGARRAFSRPWSNLNCSSMTCGISSDRWAEEPARSFRPAWDGSPGVARARAGDRRTGSACR